jgi:hypothetical protein
MLEVILPVAFDELLLAAQPIVLFPVPVRYMYEKETLL